MTRALHLSEWCYADWIAAWSAMWAVIAIDHSLAASR